MSIRFRPQDCTFERCGANASSTARRLETLRRKFLTCTVRIAVVSILIWTCAPSLRAADPDFPDDWYFDQQEALRSNLEGGLAIELSTDTWIGESTTLDDSRGKVVVLDFWATWCGPCIASIPKNIEMVETHPDDLVFIGMHSATSGWDKAPQMVKDRGINYPVVLDTGETAEAYGINAFPTYIIIDRSGIIRAAGVKPNHVKTIVEQLIEESGPTGHGLKIAAFDRDWFYRGSERMRPWQEQFGQPARPIRARAWWKPGESDDSDGEGSDTKPPADSDPEDSDLENVAVALEAPDGLEEAEMNGVVRVLHFTRPGMAITHRQLNALNDTASKYAPQGVVFAVICDHQSDWAATRAFAAKIDLGVPMALDAAAKTDPDDDSNKNTETAIATDGEPGVQPREAGRTAQSYHVRVAPVTVVVDRDGRIRATGLKLEQLSDALNLLLSERAG